MAAKRIVAPRTAERVIMAIENLVEEWIWEGQMKAKDDVEDGDPLVTTWRFI